MTTVPAHPAPTAADTGGLSDENCAKCGVGPHLACALPGCPQAGLPADKQYKGPAIAEAADTGGLVERLTELVDSFGSGQVAIPIGPQDIRALLSALAASEQREAAAREQIAELERRLAYEVEKLGDIISDEQHRAAKAEVALSSAHETIRAMREALGQIKWRSTDKDNMEFSATVTCWQMDAIRAALTLAAKEMPE